MSPNFFLVRAPAENLVRQAKKPHLRAEELLLKHEDEQLVLTIVSVENLHIH
jgi:hypothetical protein